MRIMTCFRMMHCHMINGIVGYRAWRLLPDTGLDECVPLCRLFDGLGERLSVLDERLSGMDKCMSMPAYLSCPAFEFTGVSKATRRNFYIGSCLAVCSCRPVSPTSVQGCGALLVVTCPSASQGLVPLSSIARCKLLFGGKHAAQQIDADRLWKVETFKESVGSQFSWL